MKKLLLVFAALSMVGSSAFAFNGPEILTEYYICQLPKDVNGSPILGGPAYTVALSAPTGTVALLETVGADEGRPLATESFEMTKIQQEVDGALFEAGNVVASISPAPRWGV